MFTTYLKLGFDHILDFQGYDHILYVLTLCSIYSLKEYKKVLILISAFTLGHSLTLCLAALNIISISSYVIELLIPITILVTAINNIISTKAKGNINYNYAVAASFGLIHGLGFSYFFRALLDKEESILGPLIPFNIGVEIGQIVIVFFTLLLSYIFVSLLKVKHSYWNITISIFAIIISSYLIIDRI